jgi:hypothetical protein
VRHDSRTGGRARFRWLNLKCASGNRERSECEAPRRERAAAISTLVSDTTLGTSGSLISSHPFQVSVRNPPLARDVFVNQRFAVREQTIHLAI